MINATERLARRVRAAMGDHNNDDLPVTQCVINMRKEVVNLQAQLSEAWAERDRLKGLGNKLYAELMQWAPNIRDRETVHAMRDWENEIFHNRQQPQGGEDE